MPAQGFAGANVTIPHKLRALELADAASDVARRVGAANTLTFGTGGIEADNTDVDGLLGALAERAPRRPAGMTASCSAPAGPREPSVFALLAAGAARAGLEPPPLSGRGSWSRDLAGGTFAGRPARPSPHARPQRRI